MAKDAGGARANGHLTKEQLLAALAVREEDYDLAGIEGILNFGTIRIRGLNVSDGLPALQQQDDPAARLKMICLMGIVEPKLTPEDLDELGECSAELVSNLALRIMQISGMVADEVQAFLPQTGALKRSSSTAPKSSTGSPAKSA